MEYHQLLIDKISNSVIWNLNKKWNNVYSVKSCGINAWDWYTISIETDDNTDREGLEDDIDDILDIKLSNLSRSERESLIDEYYSEGNIKIAVQEALTKKRYGHVALKKIQERLY